MVTWPVTEISALVKEVLRDFDILSRYGGEEFLVIAPNTSPADIAFLAERLRGRIETHAFLKDHEELTGRGLQITISIGLASFNSKDDDMGTLIGNADRNLYQAKHEGRNRVVGESDTATNAGISKIATKVG